IGRKKVSGVMLADANFGILPRDPDIADLFNASKQQHEGYPQHIFWSAAKNNPDRVISIAKKFSSSGICTSHALSIQHTRKEVLAATQRSNISAAKQVEVTKAMMAVDVPIEVQLILGIPGDTYELWKGCLADLMEWGIHEDYLIQAYRLLPNAPAADPAFMESWRIETVERVMHDWIVRDVNAPVSDIPQKPEQVVVSSRTFDREDWVRMSTYSAFVKAFHNAALLQRVAVYLRLTHGISYLDFYQGLIEEFARSSVLATRWYDEVANHYREFLVREDASDHMEIHEMPQLTVALHPSRWIFIQACLEIDKFYAAVKDYLVGRWPTIANLPGVIDYQRELVIHPSYDSATGKGFRAEVDWPGYFAVTRGRVGSESLAEPEAVPGAVIQVSDTTSGERVNSAYESSGTGFYGNPLEWGDGDEAARWAAWVERTVIGRSSAGMNNLQQLRLKSGG
ncbi:MAG TPA: hypothetical protein VHJ83_11940, partial [Micromonosporaceae bacterium]|nr:hypothetical protein [Micromonosporaceae bacterium]